MTVEPPASIAPAMTTPLGFDAFYREQRDHIAAALALSLGNPVLGNEAADEAFARAFQRWSTISAYDNPSGWVYRVGLNWGRSWLRKIKRERLGADESHEASATAHYADPLLAQAIAELDLKHRSVVVLRYLCDWSVDDTAEALSIKPGTVKSRLSRALKQLEIRLRDREVTP